MKNTNKIDTYLLERYPGIWNTKIIWMLIITIPIHLLFLAIGWSTGSSLNILQDNTTEDYYFSSGLIIINLIISLLLVMGWLINMFKNNAFKHFYPIKKTRIFIDFLQYLVILFISICFYISYLIGGVSGAHSSYPEHILQKEIETLNLAKAFLPQDINDYYLMSRAYPKIFTEVYYETDENLLLPGKIYTGLNGKFQINSTKQVTRVFPSGNVILEENSKPHNNDKTYIKHVRIKNTIVYTVKEKVLDLGPLVETTFPSYTNYSTQFFPTLDSNGRLSEYSYDSIAANSNKSEKLNKEVIDLLQHKDPSKLKSLLKEALVILDKYKIKHNFSLEDWYNSINKTQPYEVKTFFKSTNLSEDPYNTSEVITEMVEPASGDKLAKIGNEYASKYSTNKSVNLNLLKDIYTNINKTSHIDFLNLVNILYWIAFHLACIILIFRTLGLKPLLFGVIGTGVISLIIGLISLGIYKGVSTISGLNALNSLSIAVGLLILAMAFTAFRVSKFIRSIALSIALGVSFYFVWLVVKTMYFLISTALQDPNEASLEFTYNESSWYLQPIWAILSLLLVYFLCRSIRGWKAMPE